ncbi:hect domain and rcc1 family domain containing protein [Nannochloropsis oceanica]
MEPNEGSSGEEGPDQEASCSLGLRDDSDIEALEGQLNELLNIAPVALAPERLVSLRSWVERAVESATLQDDLAAKRRLRKMVVGGICQAQRNVKLWREMNALRVVVEEAVRARPPVSKVKDSFVVGLGIGEGVLQEAEEACYGHMGDALERIAKEDGRDKELVGGLVNLTLEDDFGSHFSSNERRLFGARELRRLSHDSVWLLVRQAADHPPAQQKLLYLVLCKLRELFHGDTDEKGRTHSTLSLETKERLKLAACAGHVREVLLLLTIAHDGQRRHQKQRQDGESVPHRHATDCSSQEEGEPRWRNHEKEHDDAEQKQERENESFTVIQSNYSAERDFLCPLTGTTLRQPVTLPCQHSFCKAALEQYLVEQGEKWTAAGLGEASSDRSNTSSSAGMIDDIRRCPLTHCRERLPLGSLSINRALDENIQRYFPKHEVVVAQSPISPGTKATVVRLIKGKDNDPIDALRTVGFRDEQIARALEAPLPVTAGTGAAAGGVTHDECESGELVDYVRRAICQLLREDTTPVSASLQQTVASSILSHSDLRRLNLDTLGCLIEALSCQCSISSSSSNHPRTAYDLLARIDCLFRDGEGVISFGMRQRLQRAVVDGKAGHVDTILRFLGAPDLSTEVDVEVVLQDQLTGIILVDPVTLGCGHTFGKSALLRYLQSKPETHRLCPLCNWSIPLDFHPIIDPLVSAFLTLSFYDKITADLEAVKDAISTAPVVLTVTSSYIHQTDVLTKALSLLSRWAADGPRHRVVLHFHGAISPILDVLQQHGRHQQLVMQAMEILSVLAQDEGPALDMLRAGAVTVLFNDTTAGGRKWWPPAIIQDVDQKRLRLLIRLVCCSGAVGSPSSFSPSSSYLSIVNGAAPLPYANIIVVLEKHLALASSKFLQLLPVDVLDLFQALSLLVEPSWFTEANLALVMSAAADSAGDCDSFSSIGDKMGLGLLLIKFLEQTLDAAGTVKDKRLATSMTLHPSFPLMKDLLLGSSSTLMLPLPTLMAEAALHIPPPPPMFFVSHSNCTLQEGSGSIVATLGGGAGAEYGFGAYALGPVIPVGHAGAWEVKLVKEKRHNLDPTWSGEEFVVVGISTTASLAPDWSFFQRDKHRNPVAGINCSTGQVLVWGRTHAQYPPMISGDSIRVGVDLRGPRHFLVLHKHTPETPDRLLFRIALPERLERAYPAVIIFNRLSYTGRAFSAELSLTNPPPRFDFLAWMANAEAQERKRDGSTSHGNRQPGAGSSTKKGWETADGVDGAMVAGNRTPLKYLEPLPKAFNHHGDLLTRTCRLGVHLQRVSSRGSFGLHKKGVYTYLFGPKRGKYHVIGLSDGIWGSYPPLPPVFSFGLEYFSTGVFRILSSSGPILERTLLSFGCGVAGEGGSAASGDEVKIEVTMFRAWDEKAALAFARGGELSSTMLDVSVFLNGSSIMTERVVVMINPANIRPFVGLIQDGDAISAVYAFSPLPVKAQIRWLSTCLATLEDFQEKDGEVHASSLEGNLRPASLKGQLERLAELFSSGSSSINKFGSSPFVSSSTRENLYLEECLQNLLSDLEHTSEKETIEAFSEVGRCQILFHVLHALTLAAPLAAPALLRCNVDGFPLGSEVENGEDERGEEDLSVNGLGGLLKGVYTGHERVCRIVGLLWEVILRVLVRHINMPAAVFRSLVDAGLVDAALHTLDTVAGWPKKAQERRGERHADDDASKNQQRQQLPYEIILNVLAALQSVAKAGNPYHLYALTQSMTRLIKHVKFPRETQAARSSLDDMDTITVAETDGGGSSIEKGSDDMPHVVNMVDDFKVHALQEAVCSKVVDLYLLLLRSFASFPPVARETLLVQRQVERLVKPLQLRLATLTATAAAAAAAAATADTASTDWSENELGSALVGILTSGDEHAWELTVWEASALGHCRTLSTPSVPPIASSSISSISNSAASFEKQEELYQEVEALLGKGVHPHVWASYSRSEWGPWGHVEHWQEALFGALLDGDVSWVVQILAGPERWKTIRQQPCFTSRRGPWAGVLVLLPCSVVGAVRVLMEQAQVAEKGTDHLGHVRDVLCVLESVLQARETQENLAFTDAPPLLVSLPQSLSTAGVRIIYEKADRTMGLFNVDAKACVEAFGVQPGDRVRPRRSLSSLGSVVGVCEQGWLWIHYDEDAGASFRSDNWCNVELEVVSRGPLTQQSLNTSSPASSSSSSSSSWRTGGLWPVFASSHLLEAGDDGKPMYREILKGSRVTRGPTWKRGLEDGKPGNLGVVVKRSGDEVIVKWNGSDEQKSYRYSATAAGPHDVSWAFTIKDLVKCDSGMDVVRGPHWRFGQQDGGFYNPGRVVAVKGTFVVVQWAGEGDEEEEDDVDEEEQEEKEEDEEEKEKGENDDVIDDQEEDEEAPSARPSLRHEKQRCCKKYGYWYGGDYREVELLVRGCERLATIDSRKEHDLIDSQGVLVLTLQSLIKGGREGSTIQAMHLIACLALTPIPSVTYELLLTCRVHHFVFDVLAEPSASAHIRQAALRALIALLRGGRGPSFRLLLQDSKSYISKKGNNSSSRDSHFAPFILHTLESMSSSSTCKALAAVVLRHLAKGAMAAQHWDAKTALLTQFETSPSSVEGTVNGLLEVLSAEVILDVHVLLSCVYTLSDVAALWPAFRRALTSRRNALLGALQRLAAINGAELVVGAAVQLAIEIMEEEAELLLPHLPGLLMHVKDLRVYEALQPFKLLRAWLSSSPSSTSPTSFTMCCWTPQQHAHLLHASAIVITRSGNASTVLEKVVVEDALDLYLAYLSTATTATTETVGGSSSSRTLACGETTTLPLAAACNALRLMIEVTGVDLYDELERRRLSKILRTLHSNVVHPAATASQSKDDAQHVERKALAALLPSFLALVEVYSEVSHTCQLQDEERRRQAWARTNPLTCSDVFPAIDQNWLQVSTGVASKLALLDNNSSTYWQSTERSRFPLTIIERRPKAHTGAGVRVAGNETRKVGRPEVDGHTVTIHLPGGNSTSSSTESTATAVVAADDDDDDDDDDEDLLVESGGPQPSRLYRVSPEHHPPPSLSSPPFSPTPEWTRLEVRRGMHGNFTPSQMWVLVKASNSAEEGEDSQKSEESLVLVRRHLLREQDAGEWETLVERAELEAVQQELGLTEIESIHVEIFRNHGQGNNCRLSGVRYSCAESWNMMDVLPSQEVLGLLQDYEGSGHHFLAAALSILQRTWETHRTLEQLRYDDEWEEEEEKGREQGFAIRRPHIGSLVRCRRLRDGSQCNAIVTAVRVLSSPTDTGAEVLYDVQYFDHDSDGGRPLAALTPMSDARCGHLQAHRFIEEVVTSYVREKREWSLFARCSEDSSRLGSNQTTQQEVKKREQQQGASPRVSVSALARGLGRSLHSFPASFWLPSRESLGGDFAQTGNQKVQCLRHALRETQTAFSTAIMDETLRSSLEGQLGLYQQVVSAQEALLLRHLQVAGDGQPLQQWGQKEEEEEAEDEGAKKKEEEEDEEENDFGDYEEDGMGSGEDEGYQP